MHGERVVLRVVHGVVGGASHAESLAAVFGASEFSSADPSAKMLLDMRRPRKWWVRPQGFLGLCIRTRKHGRTRI